MNEEMRRKSQTSSSTYSKVLSTEDRGRSKSNGTKGRDKSWTKSRSSYKDVKSHYCAKLNHIQRKCFQKNIDGKNGNENQDNDQIASISTSDLVVICDESILNAVCHETSWIVDSGASLQVTSRKKFFTSYTHGDFGVL